MVFGRSRDRDSMDVRVRQHVFESREDAHAPILARQSLGVLCIDVEDPGQLAQLVEVAYQILTPVAAANHADFGGNRSIRRCHRSLESRHGKFTMESKPKQQNSMSRRAGVGWQYCFRERYRWKPVGR